MSEPDIIATRGLSKSFGTIAAVSELNLRVPRGCVYGFLGPNGAGKTTTIRLLLGLIRPDQGEITAFGLDLRSCRKQILKRVGSLVETPPIYPRLTGRENLRVLTRLTSIPSFRIEEALRLVELSHAARQIAGQYSQGMKQRLGLAMALLNRPEFLVLDEPANGLDPAGIREIRELLKRLSAERGVTVFLSSHLLSEVELTSTHVGIIHKGKLLFQGKMQELQAFRSGHTLIRTNNAQAAVELLRGHAVRCHLEGEHVLDVETAGQEDAARVNSMLIDGGLRVYAVEPRNGRLEEFFIQLTAKER